MSANKARLFHTFAEAALQPLDEEGPHAGLRRYQIGNVGPVKRFFGTITITAEHFAEVVQNFHANAAGVTHPKTGKPAVHWDYSHDDGGPAAGWIHDVETDGTGLFAWTAWTPKAGQALTDGEFIGSSMELDFAYVDNAGKEWGCVLLGSALTNIPAIKDMTPVALQEQAQKEEQEMLKELLEKFKAAPEAERVTMLAEILKAAGKEGIIELSTQATAFKAELDALKLEVAKGGDKALQAEITRLSTELAASKVDLAKQAKEASFSELLAKGLAVPAQKESFMSGDMAKFAELSEVKKVINLNTERGSGQNNGEAAAKDAEEAGKKLVALAEVKVKADKLSFREAMSAVRGENPDLVKLADA